MKVDADHIEILQFSRLLKEISQALDESSQRAEQRLIAYNQHHQDRKYQELAEKLASKHIHIKNVSARLEAYARHLDQLSRPLKAYHDLKI